MKESSHNLVGNKEETTSSFWKWNSTLLWQPQAWLQRQLHRHRISTVYPEPCTGVEKLSDYPRVQWLSQSEPSLTAGALAALFWDTAGSSLVSEDVSEAGMQENGNPSRDGGDTIEMPPMGVEGTHPGQGHISRDKEDPTATWSLWETMATGSLYHTQTLWG